MSVGARGTSADLKAARRDGRAAKLLRVLADELMPPHARLWWANALGRLLPAGAGGRLRARLYATLGAASVAPETMITGAVTFSAARGVRPEIRFGRRCFLNAHVYLDATAPVILGDRVSVGHHVRFVTAGHEIGGPDCRAGDLRPAPITVGDGARSSRRTFPPTP
jgi:maltose O-acetyltransferase